VEKLAVSRAGVHRIIEFLVQERKTYCEFVCVVLHDFGIRFYDILSV